MNRSKNSQSVKKISTELNLESEVFPILVSFEILFIIYLTYCFGMSPIFTISTTEFRIFKRLGAIGILSIG